MGYISGAQMKATGEIGMKITAAQREYFRYTGVSAEAERRGMGASRPELAWARGAKQQDEEQMHAGSPAADQSGPDQSKEKSRK